MDKSQAKKITSAKIGVKSEDLDDYLPPPAPPTSTRDELLKGKEDLMKAMDNHAKSAHAMAGNCDSVNEFAVTHLLSVKPGMVVQKEETVFTPAKQN